MTDCTRLYTKSPLRFCFVIDALEESRSAIERLLAEGHSLFLLSTITEQNDHPPLSSSLKWEYLNDSGPPISSLLPALNSYKLFTWLRDRQSHFDAVCFPLKGGWAYYALIAKHQGLAFEHHLLLVDCNRSALHEKQTAHEWMTSLDDLAIDFLERQSYAMADAIIPPTPPLDDWMRDEQWKRIAVAPHTSSACSLESLPLVSICLTHYNRPGLLALALESIRAQDYPHFDVILVDDASSDPAAIAYLDALEDEFRTTGWTLIRNPHNLFPSAARNRAARASTAEYLLFMDDDNYAKYDEISTFVRVAKKTKADILTCAMDVFSGSSTPDSSGSLIHCFLPIGAAAHLGLFINMFGDMNALIKREVYLSLGGLTEKRGVGGEDWEFFNRAVSKGFRLEAIPLPLFWYRDTPNSITKSTALFANAARAVSCYFETLPFPLRAHLLFSQSMQRQLQELSQVHNSPRLLISRFLSLLQKKGKKVFAKCTKIIKNLTLLN